jgi:hypothetical protein
MTDDEQQQQQQQQQLFSRRFAGFVQRNFCEKTTTKRRGSFQWRHFPLNQSPFFPYEILKMNDDESIAREFVA